MPRAADCRIVVGCRVRPLNEQELELGNASIWTSCGETKRIWRADDNTGKNKSGATTTTSKPTSKPFQYDHVFGQEDDNDDVYEKLGQPIISGVLDGFHGTIFAYGQTSSGKTHTLLGTAEEMGVIVHSVHDIFEYVSRAPPEMEFLIRVSYLEIYNEEVRDLLGGNTESGGLRIVDDPQKGCHVRGLKEVVVLSPDHVFELLRSGEAKRHYGATKMNYTSSRSHTLFRMVVESRTDMSEETKSSEEDEKKESVEGEKSSASDSGLGAGEDDDTSSVGKVVQVAQLNLVDLAGSERVSKTEATGARLKEGAAINKSLLVLGTVINKLADGHKGHIPFRDSKLTRLLSNSLGGNAKTAVVCTLSPAERNYDESKSTLQFASRAKTIVNKAVKNHVMDKSALLDQYKQEVAQLKLQLASGGSVVDLPELSQVRQQLREEESKRQALEAQSEQHKVALQEMRKLVLLTSKLAANPAVSGELQERIRAVADGSAPPQKVLREVEALMETAEKEQRTEDGIGEDEKLSFEQLSKILNLKRTKRKRRRLSSLCQSIVTTMAEQRKIEEVQETSQLCKDHLSVRVAQLQKNLDAMTAERDAAVTGRQSAEGKAKDVMQQLQASTEKVQELTESVVSGNTLLQETQDQLREAIQQRAQLESQLGDASARVEAASEEAVRSRKTAVLEMKAQVENLTQERAELCIRLQDAEKSQREQKSASELQLKKLSQDLANRDGIVSDLKAQVASAESDIETLRSKRDEAERELETLRNAHAQLRLDRDEMERINSLAVQRQEAQLNDLLARLEQQQSRSKTQLGSQEAQLSTLRGSVQAYEAKIRALQRENDASCARTIDQIHVRATLLDFVADLERQMQAAHDIVQVKLDCQEARLEEISQFVPHRATVFASQQELQDENTKLKSELKRLTAACSAAQDRAISLQDHLHNLQHRQQRKQQQQVQYGSRAAERLEHASDTQSAAKSASLLQRRREEALLRENEALKAKLAAAESTSIARAGQAEDLAARERRDLMDDLETLESELERARQKAESAHEDRAVLKQHCLELQLELDRAAEKAAQAHRGSQDLLYQVQDKLEHATTAWEEARMENKRLRRKLHDARHNSKSLRDVASEAQQEAAHATETFLAYQRGAEERAAHLELFHSSGEIADLRKQLDAAHSELDVFKRLDVYSASLKRGLRSYRPEEGRGGRAHASANAGASASASETSLPSRKRTERLLRILQEQHSV
ncbi:Kinesin-related protein 4 [Hondaea fermentalgiana]|uniref:Kinesin-related protein 4 n=1 Tax=Hondaea fermentalgiana TaxID=2315210 RepID=A0A2R5GKV6_9STRA|nr:Kinesin-related protein 4 [Hondaea fermentalgiana]|eukprot:GBG31510.1 Kinesin-related protein 4 [Hondaea fermentalgiana]